MACLLCRLICDRLIPAEKGRHAFWQYSREWETVFARDWEPWHPSDEVWDRAEILATILKSDPAAGIHELAALAELNSAWAAHQLGRYYEHGYVVDRDIKLAKDYYEEAVHAGSWMGSRDLAGLIFKHLIGDEWEAILKDGDAAGFVPSTFWLAWYSYKRSPTRSTARELRPLFEKASQAGHPGARRILTGWKFTGKFGLREIRQGLREAGQAYVEFVDREFPQREPPRLELDEAA